MEHIRCHPWNRNSVKRRPTLDCKIYKGTILTSLLQWVATFYKGIRDRKKLALVYHIKWEIHITYAGTAKILLHINWKKRFIYTKSYGSISLTPGFILIENWEYRVILSLTRLLDCHGIDLQSFFVNSSRKKYVKIHSLIVCNGDALSDILWWKSNTR